jgi:type 1 glutamine amidotransferase
MMILTRRTRRLACLLTALTAVPLVATVASAQTEPAARPSHVVDPGLKDDDITKAPPRIARVLVFTKTAGFRHGSIASGVAALAELGPDHAFRTTHTEDAAVFTDDGLARFDVIVFLNTTGDILDDDQQAAMERFIRAGRGFVGIHSATDTEYDWPWYTGLVGAQFRSHPPVQPAEIDVIDREHPATAHLPARWPRTDEWYDFRAQPPSTVRILMNLDESTYNGGQMGTPHPIAWCHEYDGGRAIYTAGGHTNESFAEPDFRAHLAGAIRWAAEQE